MIIEIKCNELKNIEGKPMFHLLINGKHLAKIYADVVDKAIIDDENIKLYKGKDEMISFMRHVKVVVPIRG